MLSASKMDFVTCPVGDNKPVFSNDEAVELLIYRSAMRGGTFVTLSEDSISVVMHQYLHDLGYDVELIVRHEGDFYKISWGGKYKQ